MVAADLVAALRGPVDGAGRQGDDRLHEPAHLRGPLRRRSSQLRPDWHSDDDDAGAIKVVMTGSASDPLEWQPHIGKRRSGATTSPSAPRTPTTR